MSHLAVAAKGAPVRPRKPRPEWASFAARLIDYCRWASQKGPSVPLVRGKLPAGRGDYLGFRRCRSKHARGRQDMPMVPTFYT